MSIVAVRPYQKRINKMEESLLQKNLIKKIKDKTFLESIENVQGLEDAIKIDHDPNTIPEFSIDYLLKRKYSKSAKDVLSTLTCYEIITGDEIKNISLNKTERLFPDCLLFNHETNEIIVIENKISKQTERETLTELLAYGQEIRNILPFISDFDISYIIISTEFNTLLDHSISSQILSSESKILCLKVTENNEQVNFDVHFPKSWSNIGQNGLPASAFMSYTLCLKKKEDIDISYTEIVQHATDLINFDANQNKCSGFCVAWENGIEDLSDFEYGISIYSINQFAFIPNAVELGCEINTNSKLAEYILKKVEEYGIEQAPNSLFRIADRAKKLLDKYFIAKWDRNTTWEEDLNDDSYKLQRFPVFVESWGVVGDFLRYFYYHPAVENFSFHKKELINSSPNSPQIALQIINIITGNYLFKKGHFSAKDIFQFGKQMHLYGYACQNALETSDKKVISNEAFLFWSALPLIKSLKEISWRANCAINIRTDNITPIRIYDKKESVEPIYHQTINKFVEWFANDFLEKESIASNLFEIGFKYAPFFSDFFKKTLSSDNVNIIKKELNNFTISVLSYIVRSYKERILFLRDIDKNLLNCIIECDIEEFPIEKIFENIQKKKYEEIFPYEILEIVNSVYGEVYHKLKDIYISNSIDFIFLKQTADERFNRGYKYSAIIVYSNSEVGLGEIDQEYQVMGELSDTDEIYLILNPASGTQFVQKIKWNDIINGKLKKDLECSFD